IGNFARSLLRAIPQEARGGIGVILPPGSPYAGDFPGCRIHYARIAPTSHPWTELYEQVFLPFFCLAMGYRALVAFDGRIPIMHPGVRAYPFIYDLTAVTVPGSHNRRYTLLLKAAIAVARFSATGVFTISEAVRGQIARTTGLPPAKIFVIYPSDSGLDACEAAKPQGVMAPFFLAVGMTNRRKNAVNLLRAFEIFRRGSGTKVQLVATGDARLIHAAIARSGISPECASAVINLGFVKESALRWLYENARGLAYPSLDEGFGIPLVDAARHGCPVACSNIPVFREVLGSFPSYFDPASPEDIARAMREIPEERVNGSVPSLPFSWEDSARNLTARARI
ncbi:MAG TPA: glycosyltransferase family 1 protein, partial [Fibrobacteria bacterium]|nr:glycosyltransferase family 1 protein [Fibrobacteria bacterium]